MYTLVSAYGVGKNVNAKWGSATVAAMPMNEVFATFRHLYLTLSSNFLAEDIYVDFEIFRPKYGNSVLPLEDMLTDLGNDTLATITSIPHFDTKYVGYNDAFRANYKIEVSAPASHPSSVVYPDDKTEVILSRRDTNMQDVFDYCLVSINGFLHQTDTDGEKVYVLDGGKSLLKSRQNQIGLYSFEDIGKIRQHKITPEMIYAGPGNSFLKNRAYFDLSGIDTVGKTVMFVIAGYLYMPFDNHVQQVNDNTFLIDFNAVPVVERYFEALPYLDFKSLGLPTKLASPTQVQLVEFFSDEVFMKYLTHPQSFVVVADTPRMFAERHYLKGYNVPGVYTSYFDASQPMVTANGRFAEYWKTKEIGQWSLRVHDAYYHNRTFRSTDPADITAVTDSSQPYRTYRNSNAYLLSLGADVPV